MHFSLVSRWSLHWLLQDLSCVAHTAVSSRAWHRNQRAARQRARRAAHASTATVVQVSCLQYHHGSSMTWQGSQLRCMDSGWWWHWHVDSEICDKFTPPSKAKSDLVGSHRENTNLERQKTHSDQLQDMMWICRSCAHWTSASRENCFKCGQPKPSSTSDPVHMPKMESDEVATEQPPGRKAQRKHLAAKLDGLLRSKTALEKGGENALAEKWMEESKQVRAEMDGLPLCTDGVCGKHKSRSRTQQRGVEKTDEHSQGVASSQGKCSGSIGSGTAGLSRCLHRLRGGRGNGNGHGRGRIRRGPPQVFPQALRSQDVLDVHSRIDALSSKLDLLCSSLLSQSHAMAGSGHGSPDPRMLFSVLFSFSASERERTTTFPLLFKRGMRKCAQRPD